MNITIFVCGFLATLVLVWFGFHPILADVQALNAQIRDDKTQIVSLDQQIQAFTSAQSDLSKASRKDDINTAIPMRETLVLAVTDMEAAVAKSGADHLLQINDPQATALKNSTQVAIPPVISGKSGIDEVGYDLTTTTDYGGMVKLLAYLEHLPHFTEISKINLSAETREGNSKAVVHTGRVIGDINGVFFIQKPQ